MPVPKPAGRETAKKFIARFMANEAMKKEFPDHKQRLAVAYSTVRRAKKGKKK